MPEDSLPDLFHHAQRIVQLVMTGLENKERTQ